MFCMVSFRGLAGFQFALMLMNCSVSDPYFVLFTAQHPFIHWLGLFSFWKGHYAVYTSSLVLCGDGIYCPMFYVPAGGTLFFSLLSSRSLSRS